MDMLLSIASELNFALHPRESSRDPHRAFGQLGNATPLPVEKPRNNFCGLPLELVKAKAFTPFRAQELLLGTEGGLDEFAV